MYCNITYCHYKHLHRTEGHFCKICKEYGHGIQYHTMQTSNYKIKCPLCRTENIIPSTQKLITGLNQLCIVCMVNHVNVFLPQCGHTNLCVDCVKKMDNATDFSTEHEPYFPETSQIIIDIKEHPEWTFNFERIFQGIDDMTEIHNESIKIFDLIPNQIFLCAYIGMGCCIYVKRDNINAEIKTFIMHSDAWGQYGYGACDVPELNRFEK